MIFEFNHGIDSYSLKTTAELGSLTHYLWLDNTKTKALSVYFDAGNLIHRLIIKPYTTFPHSDQKLSEVQYSMPITEDWLVFWGGNNEFVNYHYIYESQRYAYDLLKIENGRSYVNNQLVNENYFAFNKEVVAPADGKVVSVVNNIKDNVPGEMNESKPEGNYAIIQHDKEEYSLLSHFKKSSITVKKGDSVRRGQLLGYCGNSGNSSEPHIHFQVMDSPNIRKCHSICIRFIDNSKPEQGDIVSMAPETLSKDYSPSLLDNIDKTETAFSFAEIFVMMQRFIVQFFKQ